MAPETLDLSDLFSKLYHTSISPDKVLTSIMVWPRKSSDSLVNFCLNLDLRSLSSSQTLTLMRSDELWHSLRRKKNNSVRQTKIVCYYVSEIFKKFSTSHMAQKAIIDNSLGFSEKNFYFGKSLLQSWVATFLSD